MHSIFKNNTSPSLHLKKTFQNKGTNYAGEAHATTSDRVGPRYGLLIGSLTCSNRFVTWFSVFLLSLKTKTSKFQSQTQGHFSASSSQVSQFYTTTVINMTPVPFSRIVPRKAKTHRLSAPAAFHTCWTFNASTSSFTVCTLCTWR